MQIPVIDGIYADEAADFRTAYPVNLVPVPKAQGISNGYLRPADGIVQFGVGPGLGRGGINWNGICYRVMGTSLVSIAYDGTVTTLGDVGGVEPVRLDYSFDRLAIASAGRLFYWDSTILTVVTDPDILEVKDMLFIDGYFMTTDGESLIVTELGDPYAVNPLKYGSSEVDPDPIIGLLRLQDEVYALNRNTIEVFNNVGGDLFPFQRVDGAQIDKGILGKRGACIFANSIAFLGSGRNESPSIYIGAHSQTTKIATREIDQILLSYNEGQLENVILEERADKGHQHLFVHLFDRTLVYDLSASLATQSPVWFILTSALADFATYRARNLVWCYDKWLCEDPTSFNLGYLVNTISTHYGDKVRWEFSTGIIYNESHGAIFHQLELVCLTGRVIFGENPTISSSYSVDGEAWSQDKFISVGKTGDRSKRVVWFQQGHMKNWRIQRFQGTSDAHLSIARLEAQLEPLAF